MRLKSRIEALGENPLFAEFIISIQKAKYDLEIDSAHEREKGNFAGHVLLRPLPSENSEYDYRLVAAFMYFMDLNRWKRLTFILDRPTPWLKQENQFQKSKLAHDYFLELGIESDFTGAIEVNNKDLEQFFPHLFWLSRSNMELPTCFFIAPESKAVGSICQYGILHFETYSEAERSSILMNASKAGLEEYTELHCTDQIDNAGWIDGRELNI